MLTKLKNLFINRCPACNGALAYENGAMCYVKLCPQGHYKEETYCALEVKIVYDHFK